MSRCFPYPPPGYARTVARAEAAPLIESIKLLSERPESRNDRKKEKSKHKKEKSKDKKHKSKEHKDKSKQSRDNGDRKRKEVKEEDLPKGTKVEAEQLEKSGLTEEHGQPVWPQSPGYLSDGSQFNHKRKRDASIQPEEGCRLGKIIRIKLASSLSHHEGSSSGSQQICSTSGRENSSNQKRDEISCVPIEQKTCLTIVDTAVAFKDPISEPKIKDPLSCAVVKGIGTHQGNVVSLPHPRTRSRAESAYETLFEKWVPTPIQFEQQIEDEEWLFGTRKHGQTTKTSNAFSSVPSCRSSSLWPKGQYLQDADVYSLPYTIPF